MLLKGKADDKNYIENGGTIIDEDFVSNEVKDEVTKEANFDSLDETSQKISKNFIKIENC
mgnify:CR=1 FL=1